MNKKRIWQMTKLAMFEEDNQEDISITNFYRRDYVALGMILNAILVTISYIIILGVIVISASDFLEENIYKYSYQELIMPAAIGYIIVMALYLLLVFILRRTRYNKASRHMEKYYDKLNKFSDYYESSASRGKDKKEEEG